MSNISRLESKNNSINGNRLAEALHFREIGFSLIPIETDGGKKPTIKWEQYQNRKPTEDELTNWFAEIHQDLAIIGGAVSGNLAVLDFDEKTEKGNFRRWRKSLSQELLAKLSYFRTPSGGYHGYCRTASPQKTKKLARTEKGETLIELKADGGYVLAPGVQSYGPYTFVGGCAVDQLPVLTDEEWSQLEQAATALNRHTKATPTDYQAVDQEHAEAIKTVGIPVEERIQAATRWLDRCEGAKQGRGADNYCLALAVKLLWGFAVPEDEANDLLYNWGLRDDQQDGDGNYYPWSDSEIRHKIQSAVTASYEGTIGDQVTNSLTVLETTANEIIKGSKVVTDTEPTEAKEEDKRRRRGYKIAELRKLPKAIWQIDQHFTRNAFGLTFGPSGSYKSFYVLDQGLCIATGKPFLGRFNVVQGPVCYVAAEGQFGISKRIDAWLKYHKQTAPDNFVIVPDAFDLMRTGDALEILEICQTDLGTMPDLIIIDTMARNFGPGDENNPKDMGNYVRNIDFLRKSGATINSVHHTGWKDTNRERGNNQLRGACDFITGVAKDDKAEQNGFLSSLDVRCIKQKDFEPFPDYLVVPSRVDLGTDENGQKVNSLVLNRLTNPWLETYIGMKPKTQELLAVLHNAFAEGPFSWTDAKAAGGQPRGTFNKSWDQLKWFKFIQAAGEHYSVLPQTASVLLLANNGMVA